jgi:hypothetical protein
MRKEECRVNPEQIILVQTCPACPEQYDAFGPDGKLVGYIRLRWGMLVVRPDAGSDEIIYSKSIGDRLTGAFESARQRHEELENVKRAIIKHLGTSPFEAKMQ